MAVTPPRPLLTAIPTSTSVRGRVRFRVPALRGCPALATRVVDRLAGLDAVHSVRVNHLTGSVLVHFAADRTTIRDIAAELVRSRNAVPWGSNGHAAAAGTPEPGVAPWHALPGETVVEGLRVVPSLGLSSSEVTARLARHGPNRFPAPAPKSGLAILVDQVTSLPVALLAGAAAVSLVSGAIFDALVIVGVVAANAVIGYVTESRVERILTSLQQLTSPVALVRRDGKEVFVPASSLVPGDVMVLKAGHDVHADGRVIDAGDLLALNESTLTGESLPVVKTALATRPAETPIAGRDNMVFAGTVVSEGAGLAVVTETGRRAELGRIRALIAETTTPPTPLELHLDRMGRSLVTLTLGLSAGTLALGLLRGVGLLDMTRTAISLAVAAVPEGLPTVATTTLALGMHRMLRRNVLVRRLQVIESLGTATVICVDKTGTLTENRMTVRGWAFDGLPFIGLPEAVEARETAGGPPLDALPPCLGRAVLIGVLCNEAELTPVGDGWVLDGSPTEGALIDAARVLGIDYRQARNAYRLCARRDRGEGQNWMATVHEAGAGGRLLVAVKGAPEEVLRLCNARLRGDGELEPLGPEARRTILAANSRMAGEAMRVLGLAYAERNDHGDSTYDDLAWVGLVGMADPIRPGVREAIAACHRAGIRIIMVTGDQSPTAIAVGRALGLVSDGQVRVLDATDLARVDRPALRGLAREVNIFARVSPAHKYQIVRALQESGEVVAMTGDGVNDGPALRAADIGVAMGARGTEVARDLGDVVLLDDNFGSIVQAIEHGRAVHTNVRKALRFLLSTNLSEILLTMATTAVGLASPLSAVQLLWINLLSDVLPALALAVEPAEADAMTRPPRDPSEPILSGGTLRRIAIDGGLLTAASFGAYGAALARHGAGPLASTVAFSTLTAGQLLHALSCRSDDRSALSGLRSSGFLVGAVGGTLALQGAALTLPPLRTLLGTAPLGVLDWGLVAGGALLPLAVREIEKARIRPARPRVRPA